MHKIVKGGWGRGIASTALQGLTSAESTIFGLDLIRGVEITLAHTDPPRCAVLRNALDTDVASLTSFPVETYGIVFIHKLYIEDDLL